MFLLDTNVISELRKARTGKGHPNVVTWAAQTPPSQLFISAITVLELEMGVLQIERRDAVQGQHLRQWLDTQVMVTFAERILSVDASVALQCASPLRGT